MFIHLVKCLYRDSFQNKAKGKNIEHFDRWSIKNT